MEQDVWRLRSRWEDILLADFASTSRLVLRPLCFSLALHHRQDRFCCSGGLLSRRFLHNLLQSLQSIIDTCSGLSRPSTAPPVVPASQVDSPGPRAEVIGS